MEIEIMTWRVAMPTATATAITDRTTGCISNVLVDHHKAPIEISDQPVKSKPLTRTSCCWISMHSHNDTKGTGLDSRVALLQQPSPGVQQNENLISLKE